MYKYKIGFGTFEESGDWEFTHEQKFTEIQLRKCVERALIESGAVQYKKRSSSNSTDLINIAELMGSNTFNKCMKKQGFVKDKYDVKVRLFGWSRPFKKDDHWTSDVQQWEKEIIQNIDKAVRK